MAIKLKDHYNADYAQLLSKKIKAVYPDFSEKQFIEYVQKNIGDKEFIERQDVFVAAFEQTLLFDYQTIIDIFTNILGPELEKETGMFTDGWWLWPIGRYVEKHGGEDVNISLDFIEELTKRYTGEFAMRPLFLKDRKTVLKKVKKWSKDKNVHLRRLSSECLRIRLPWAKKSYIFIENFESCKEILFNLRNDTSKFVQKSVGNNLNDLYKECPEKAEEIINEWKMNNPTKETEWIINHGLRSKKK